jgi:hypothetical protein
MQITKKPVEHRHAPTNRPSIGGVSVRDDDIESDKALRAVARLFRGMAILLVLLMVVQVIAAATSTVPLSVGVVAANAIRLIIFAGLLWATGDVAVFIVKSHYDLRATRILVARVEHTLKEHLAGAAVDEQHPEAPRPDGAR